jgi:hypothetical protein
VDLEPAETDLLELGDEPATPLGIGEVGEDGQSARGRIASIAARRPSARGS